jgi:formylglycine-generating enzyme required for sulfatase activity
MAEGGGCGCNALSRDAASEREGMNSIGEGKPSAVDASEQLKGTASSASAVTEEQGRGTLEKSRDTAGAKPPTMIWVPGGEFVMGHNNQTMSPSTFFADGEGPTRRVSLSGFWIGETEVSNAQWAAFTADTTFTTDSERFGWSFVFEKQLTKEANDAATQAVQVGRCSSCMYALVVEGIGVLVLWKRVCCCEVAAMKYWFAVGSG